MTPAKPPKPPTDPPSKRRDEWSLTQEAFEKLLAAFSSDADEAARQYEALRTRLIRFFEWRSIPLAEDRADEVLNRVARRIDEGEQIKNMVAYAYRIAYFVSLEALKEPELVDIDQELTNLPRIEPHFEDTRHEQRQRCFYRCLESLTINSRKLILVYYEEAHGAKIEQRRNLADQLKITIDALRIRTHRIRKRLEECIASCLRPPDATRNVTR
jgi:DNA-directed RNA polymerase specialized sigma24 family protein